METVLENKLGERKSIKIGFSWTTFFFGVFVPLLRGDLKYTMIMCVIALITNGISWLVFPFIYNKLYIQDLLNRGFRPIDSDSEAVLRSKGFGF